MLFNSSNTSKEPSSIDRFFWTTGSRALGRYSTGAGAMYIVGAVQLATALIFLGISFATHKITFVLPTIFGLVGMLLLGVGYFYNRMQKAAGTSEIRLTAQARKLMYKIGAHIGWQDQAAYWGGSYSRNSWWSNLMGVKTASQVLNEGTGKILEDGCFEYNRLCGLQKLAKEKQRGNAALLNQVRAAAEEGIIGLLNQVALMEETPESRLAIQSQAIQQVSKLRELATRFEQSLVQPETITDRLSSTTIMDNLLEQMRHESQARVELEEFDLNEKA